VLYNINIEVTTETFDPLRPAVPTGKPEKAPGIGDRKEPEGDRKPTVPPIRRDIPRTPKIQDPFPNRPASEPERRTPKIIQDPGLQQPSARL
jgi:hypothetical protein